MRKSILFIMMVAVAFFAVACGGNNAAGNGAAATGGDTGGTAADPYALYKKKDRSWTHKNTAGGMVTYMLTEVTEVTDKEATVKTTMMGEDKKPMAGVEPTTRKQPLEAPKVETAAATGGEAPKSKEEKVKVEAGEFECISYDDGKTWMSKKYPGLIVKSEGQELVEFKE